MAKLINSRSKKLINSEVHVAKNIHEKMTGLLDSKHSAIVIHTRFGIHTFGVKHPIDVMILNSQNHVVKKIEKLRPMRFFFWNPSYSTVVELPAGNIQNSETEIGDEIEFHN